MQNWKHFNIFNIFLDIFFFSLSVYFNVTTLLFTCTTHSHKDFVPLACCLPFFTRKNEMQTVKLEKLSAVDLLLRNIRIQHETPKKRRTRKIVIVKLWRKKKMKKMFMRVRHKKDERCISQLRFGFYFLWLLLVVVVLSVCLSFSELVIQKPIPERKKKKDETRNKAC